MNSKNSFHILLTIIFIFFAFRAYADETKSTTDTLKNIETEKPLAREVVEIPEIVVSAERVEQTSKSASVTTNILSATDIAKRNASTFDQVLESVPGITINRSAGTATNSMSIRGSSEMLGGGVGNRVLLLIDGRPAITADTGGANWSLLPMDVIQRVEVVKGALSPLYGSNAMGGVVNLITKSPTAVGKTKFNLGLGYFDKPPEWMRYTEKENYFENFGVTHSNSHHNLGYILHLSGKQSDGYRQNTDFSLYNTYGKIQYVTQKDLKMGLSLGGTSMERGYPHTWLINNTEPYIHPLKVAHEKTNDRQKKSIWNVDLFLKSPINAKSKLAANLYYFDNYSQSLFNPNNLKDDNRPYGFFTDSDARKTGGLVQVDISVSPQNYLILGLDAQIDWVDSRPAEIMFGKHQANTLAGFAQDKIAVSDSLAVTLGGRYDYRYLAQGKSEGQISPKFGLSYQVNDDTTLRFSLGQAFRAPSLGEIYLKKEVNSGVNFRQNPNLKAEKLRFYGEIGLRRKLFNFLRTDTSLFIYDFADMIFWQRISENEFQVTNLNRSVIKGAETGLRFSWRRLSALANYTYLDAQDRTEGRTDDKLPYKPKHTAYASLDYQYARFRLGASIRYVSKIEETIFYPNDAPEAFYVVNTKLSYNISDRITLSVAVNNLLNRQYEEMARYRMPGRSIAFRMVVD
ncbi:MAG: TonB-dependent receptor plug domain-containing protein [Candidatus Poribacteria bacterium]